ncbi:hypothetical protein ACFQWF_14870 [Methylorubrum suomiense]
MSAEHQKRPPAEMALIEVFDATKEAQQIASAILLAARVSSTIVTVMG